MAGGGGSCSILFCTQINTLPQFHLEWCEKGLWQDYLTGDIL